MTVISNFSRPHAIHIAYAILLVSLFTLAGCATTIPETDSVPPEIRLTISGGGIGSQAMSNPPRDNWTAPDGSQYLDLDPGVSYNFVFSVSDQGGVARAHLRMPDWGEVTDLAPDDVRETVSGVSRILELRGDRSNPTTGLVITGKVSFPGNPSFEFQAEGDDFGGRAGRTNQTFMNVNTAVGLR
ncbi:MAG TPA: hypothetical protein VJ984_12795 [Xanthomonadales bacterium]|nr:hypothetical protein [Xanthomonadales bacterium]